MELSLENIDPMKKNEILIEEYDGDESDNSLSSSPSSAISHPSTEEVKKNEILPLYHYKAKITNDSMLPNQLCQESFRKMISSVRAGLSGQTTIELPKCTLKLPERVFAATYYMALLHMEGCTEMNLRGLTSESHDMENRCESLKKETQNLQKKIRLLLTGPLSVNKEEAVKEIMGREITKDAKVENFIQKGRKEPPTDKRFCKWKKRSTELKLLLEDVQNEKSAIISEIEECLETLESLDKNEVEHITQKHRKRRYSDGVLSIKDDTEGLKVKINKEDKKNVFSYYCDMLVKKGRKTKKAGMKLKFDILYELSRSRSALTKGILEIGKFAANRHLDYSDHQFDVIQRFGSWDYLQQSRSMKKEGWVFMKKGNSSFLSLKEHWERVYVQVSYLFTSFSVYPGEGKRKLVIRLSLQNSSIKAGTGLKDFAISEFEKGQKTVVLRGTSRKETGEWFIYFQAMTKREE